MKYKMKTNSSVKKRFRVTAGGLIKAKGAYKQHNMRKRPNNMLRRVRKGMILIPGDARLVMLKAPYGLK